MKRPAAAGAPGGGALKRPASASGSLKRPSAAGSGAADLAVGPRALQPADIVFGGAWLGPWPGARYEDHSQEAADAAVRAAHEAGVREFDTAPWYGWGSGEERMGKAIAKLGFVGAQVTTKVGRLFTEPDGAPAGPGFDAPGRPPLAERRISNDYTAAGVKRSFQESLQRMGMGRVHALRLHDPNDNNLNRGEVEDEVAICLADDGALEGLRELRACGLISHVGLGMNSNKEPHIGVPDEILRLIRGAPKGTFDSALLAGGWNLLTQAGLPCMLECERRGIPVYLAGVYGSGLLVGGKTYAYVDAPDAAKEKARRWQELSERHGVRLPAVALAFAALPRIVAKVIIGFATKAQVDENLALLKKSASVPMQLFHDAQRDGLLGPEVPLPAAT